MIDPNRPRVLTAATSAKIDDPVTQPGYLVEIQLTQLLRYCNRGQVTWNGNLFIQEDVRVNGLSNTPGGVSTVTLLVSNADNIIGTVLLDEGIENSQVRIWAYDQGAFAAADPVQVFSGSIEEVTDINHTYAVLSLKSGFGEALFSPREFISPALGFNFVTPANTKIDFNGETYVLERGGV